MSILNLEESTASRAVVAFEDQVRSVYPQMARITIQPEWAKLLDFETRLPSAVEELISARS
jgi:hypothetical protein